MATRNEQDTTRARANILRHLLTHPIDSSRPWDSDEIAQVMDLCLSCKACRSECPSTVDVARLKAEWLQHFQDIRGTPLRSRLIANFSHVARLGMLAPPIHNWLMSNRIFSGLLKRVAGFAPARSLPRLPWQTLRRWHATHANRSNDYRNGRIFLFCDEFTNYHDASVGIKSVRLLNRLGYEVVIPEHKESGRAQISKGLIRDARRLAIRNVETLSPVITDATPLVGIEPSAILGFRDEYPDLVPRTLAPSARTLGRNALFFEEFIAREANRGRIREESFTDEARVIILHGHCHQKALASVDPTVEALSLPTNFTVKTIPSGCCGMAGSFGYESEHYEVSMRIGELVLFPAVRSAPVEALIAASGTSCRHQIKDGTGRDSFHPAEILYDALVAPIE
jgi:Fe-S oxidoreductase